MSIGKMIKHYREKQDITSKVFAYDVYKHRSTVFNWENGICCPKAVEIVKICKVLKITPNDLFEWE